MIQLALRKDGCLHPHPRCGGGAGHDERRHARDECVGCIKCRKDGAVGIRLVASDDFKGERKAIGIESRVRVLPDGGHQHDEVDRGGLPQVDLHPLRVVGILMIDRLTADWSCPTPHI